jgi:hypothetical protein
VSLRDEVKTGFQCYWEIGRQPSFHSVAVAFWPPEANPE